MKKKEAPLYDLTKLIEMSRDNDDFVKKMVTLFISEITISMDKVREAYKTGDFEGLKFYAHRIKPSVISLGINEIKEEVKQVEMTALAGKKTDELSSMIEKIDRTIALVIAQLKSEYEV